MNDASRTQPGALDPVCGMRVDKAKARSVEHRGRAFFFCSARCVAKFEANPAAYLAPKRADATPPPARTDGGMYVCPMDPEVRQKGPGACPKCGMALEPEDVQMDGEGAGAKSAGAEDAELTSMRRRLLVSAVLTVPLVVLSMGSMLVPMSIWSSHLPWSMGGESFVELSLATPVVVWGGAPFFARGWMSVRSRSPNMFTLVALGSGAAFAASLLGTLAPSVFPPSVRNAHGAVPVYFEAAAGIVTLVLLGQVIELGARKATGAALRALLGLAPKTARRVRAQGDGEDDVAITDLSIGDTIRIRPGERVPIDAQVLAGASSCDESMITGESQAIAKQVGDALIGGTLNGEGPLVARVERTGQGTVVAQIVRRVRDAQRSRAPVQKIVDRISAFFVPAVLAIAAVTFAAWMVVGPAPHFPHALLAAVSVLIIACPCALGLAAPMAIAVGTGRGASAGILIASAEALERLTKVDTYIFDKTGTLTEGRPDVARVIAQEGFTELDVLRSAASLEVASEHPLAAAILRAAKSASDRANAGALDVAHDVEVVRGQGIGGTVGRRQVVLGNRKLVARAGAYGKDAKEEADDDRAAGNTVVELAIDGHLAGRIVLADALRPSARAVVTLLRAGGFLVRMASGDHPATARAIAKAAGIDDANVDAGASPVAKADRISALQAEGRKVAMVGDGVNDAPALAQADVGIAMGNASDVALASAGITLLAGDLHALLRARRLSEGTVRNVKQNLALSFVYNLAGIPIAAGLLYAATGWMLSPMLAAAAMSLSSISVLANALRLRRLRLDDDLPITAARHDM